MVFQNNVLPDDTLCLKSDGIIESMMMLLRLSRLTESFAADLIFMNTEMIKVFRLYAKKRRQVKIQFTERREPT